MEPKTKIIGKIVLTPKGDYVNQAYEVLDVVNKNSKTYIAIKYVPKDVNVENTEYWMPIATGPSGTIENINATVDKNIGIPEVEVILEGTPQNRNITFNFKNLKGESGKGFTYNDFTPEQIETLRIGIGSKYIISPNNGAWAEIFNDKTRNTSTASHSHVEGLDNNIESSGVVAHVEGYKNKCSGLHSHAEGASNIISGQDSHVEGQGNTVSSNYSHAECYGNQVSAPNAHAEGYKNLAAGNSAHVEGKNNIAEGVSSHCGGENNKSRLYYETVVGCYNQYQEYPGNGVTTKAYSNNVFTIGNGDSEDDRNNCFEVKFSGTVNTDGVINSPTADYAEMFEWLDSNTTSEDRVGYFVTINNNKIVKANSSSKYILGIVSSTPVIIGNNPMKWNNKYMTDDWGRIIYKDVQITIETESVREDGTKYITTETKTVKQPTINPLYNKTLEYKMRNDRPEWAAVGLIGVLRVRQDGTLTVGGYCKPNDEGVATASTEGYYVTEIINNKIAKVIFR